MTRSFHSRVLSVIVGLIVLAQVGTTAAMFIAARRTADGLADQQLHITNRLVQDVLESRDHEYRNSLQALAADFAFRDAVSSHDAPTIASALANHGARIGADVVVLLDNAGQVIASTDTALESSPSLALSQLLRSARAETHAPAIANLKGRLLQFVVVPVRAPDTVGWVGMGFVLRDFVVQQIKAIGGADITFVALNPGAAPSIAASTVPEPQRTALADQVQKLINGGADAQVIAVLGEDYLSKVAAAGGDGQPFVAIIQLPERSVTAPLLALRYDLLKWAGAVTILCLAAAVLSARLLSHPIQALAKAARSMQPVKRGREPAPAEGDDVSHLAGALHALAHRTQYDALTGLPNRTVFAEWLAAAISRAERERTPLAVVFVDLDGFKKINETLGRAMGDLVLRKTAQRLLRCVRPCDTVARFGADEFVLILDGVAQVGALEIVDRLMHTVAKPMQSPGGPIQVTMRSGVAVFPEHAQDRESLLRLADAAKHESKSRRQATVIAKKPVLATLRTLDTVVSPMRGSTTHDTWSGAPWEGDDLATQPMKKLEIDQG